jgi:hypothetical protein
LLAQQGVQNLHASAVVVDGGVVAFVGDSTAGKSTLAAYCGRRGHALFADDLLFFAAAAGVPRAVCGYPLLHLAADVIEWLGLDPQRFPPLFPGSPKRSLPPGTLGAPLVPAPMRLRALYLLEPAGAESCGSPGEVFSAISRTEALTRLLGDQFALAPEPEERATQTRRFHATAQLASAVPVRTWRVPRAFAALPAMYELLRRDLERG